MEEKNKFIIEITKSANEFAIKFYTLWSGLSGASLVALMSFVQTLERPISSKFDLIAAQVYLIVAVISAALHIFGASKIYFHSAKMQSSTPENSAELYPRWQTFVRFNGLLALASYVIGIIFAWIFVNSNIL